METLKHLLGFCGDTWHPSILNVGMLGTPLLIIYRNCKFKIKNFLKN